MKHKHRRFFLYLLLRCWIALIRLGPRSFALFLAKAIGWAAYFLVWVQRRPVLEHLRIAWKSEKDEKEIRTIGRRVFENLAMMACDVIRFPRLTAATLDQWLSCDPEIFAKIDRILKNGRGVIILTGHLGNWELLAGAFGVKGYSGAVVGKRIYYEPYNEIIVGLRQGVGVETIYRDESPRKILRILSQNQILGIVADQDVDSVEGTFVPFFGIPAYTPTAPAKLSLASGAPIVPACVIREGDRYHMMMGEPIYPEVKDSKEQTVQEITERWSREIEAYIRRYPDQWGWMHDRWKTKPDDQVSNAPAAKDRKFSGGQ